MSDDGQNTRSKNVETSSLTEKIPKTTKRVIAVLTTISAIVTIVVPIASDVIPSEFVGDYILLVLLIAFAVGFGSYHIITVRDLDASITALDKKVGSLKDEVEEANAYNHLIDQKNTSPVLVNRKDVEVKICENGSDEITFTFVLSALTGNKVDKYTALIGTDVQDVSWEDLNFTLQNGSVSNVRRRDHNDFRRFVIEIELLEKVTPDETYELSFSVKDDVQSPDNDEVFQLVRERTERITTKIIFPEGWEPKRRIAKGRGELDIESLPSPTKKIENNRWRLYWEYNSCEVGQSYVVDYTAEEIN